MSRAADDQADLWAWRDDDYTSPPVDISGEEVTCVVVAHNGAAWLDDAIESLRRLDPPPTYLLGVDAGSFDRSGEIMRRSGLFTTVVQTDASGFGEAARQALYDHDPVRRFGSRARGGQWLWFLHDDATVAPDALGELLRQAVQEPNTDVLGPKIVRHDADAAPHEDPRLESVGLTISGGGRIERHVEDGEVDQKQHRPEDVLAVDTCGMLVRRETFIGLGGFAPELPVFTDGVDFGWRAVEQGHRVRTCPAAVVTHRAVGRTGVRQSPVIAPRPTLTERVLAMRTVAAHRHGVGALWSGLGLVVSCVLRALGFLLAKAPGRAGDEMRAIGSFVTSGDTRSLRSRDEKPSTDAERRVRELRPGPFHGVALAFDAVASSLSGRWRGAFGSGTPTLDELTGDEFSGTGHTRRSWASPVWLAFTLLVVASVAAARNVIGPGRLMGPQLLPSATSLRAAFETYTVPIAGASGSLAPPWTAWVALGSTLTFGRPEWFVTLVVLGAMPLCFVASQVWLRRLTSRPMIRALGGVAYALVPVLAGAVNRGALGTIILAIGLPVLAAAVQDLFAGKLSGPDTWRPAWATGLMLMLLTPFLPPLLIAVGIALIAGGFFESWARLRRTALAVGIPTVMFGPWLISAIAAGSARILLGPDGSMGGWDIVPWWQVMLGRTPGAGLPAMWISVTVHAVLWAVAIATLVFALTRREVTVAWGVAAGAVIMALLNGRLLIQALPAGSQVRPDLTGWVVILAGALLTCAVVGGQMISGLARIRVAVGTVVALGAVSGLVAVALWAHPLLTRAEPSAMPPFVVNAQTGPGANRTLAIDLTGPSARYQLVEGDGPRLGQADRGLAHGGSTQWPDATRSVVAAMLAGSADESVGATLEQLGVAHVWVRGADAEERIRIGNTPGLTSGSGRDDWVVWRLPGTGTRVHVEQPGADDITVPMVNHRGSVVLDEGDEGRRLVLSEPADRRWKVELADRPLNSHGEGERLVVDLPSGGGELTVELVPRWPRWIGWIQLVALVVLLILSTPSLAGARARRQAAAVPPRAEKPAPPARPTPHPAPAPAPPEDPDMTRARPDLTQPRRAMPPSDAGGADVEWDTMVLPAARARRAAGPMPEEQGGHDAQQ